MYKRLLAVACLVGLAFGASRADYVIIVVNVGEARPPSGAQGQFGAFGAVGFGGQAGAFGMIGAPGGAIGVPGAAGAVGATGYPGGAPGAAGAAGAVGAPGAAGAAGAIGTPPAAAMGGAGALGTPPPIGAMGAMGAMGARGPSGGGPPGNLGPSGGGPPAGLGMIGRPPTGGGEFGPNQDQFGGLGGHGVLGGSVPEKDTKIRAMAVIEMRKLNRLTSLQKKAAIELLHTNGQTSWLWAYDVDLDLLRQKAARGPDIPLPAVYDRFNDEHKKLWARGKPQPQELVNLAERALGWGLLKQFEDTMKELTDADKTHPVAAAYQKVKAALDLKINNNKAGERWHGSEQTPFKGMKMATNDFYALLYKASEPTSAVDSRLRQLRDNFKAFYYWHALRGKALPMPQDKLVAVMIPGDGTDFIKKNQLFNGEPIVADSFFSPRYNLVVFSSRRLDVPYRGVARSTEDLWKTFNKDDIARMDLRRKPRNVSLPEFLHAQTLATLLKALDEDGERAAVSHSGTRQLLLAAGLVPGNVSLPQWLQFGVGSFMETPYGSPWRSYAAPHWSYLFSFNDLKKQGKLGPAHQLMRSIISDEMFRADAQVLSLKTRATAWAFTYYLMREHLDQLHAFYKELSRLPRDLRVEGDVLIDLFARSFDCMGPNKKRDEAKLNQLAEKFVGYIDDVKLDNDVQAILEKIHKLQNELAQDNIREQYRPRIPGLPGIPGFPGVPGFPGIPGMPNPGRPGR